MTDNLAAALAQVQANLPTISKGETAEVEGKSKTGVPYKYKYSYADLADVSQVILPLLGKAGLSWITRPTTVEGGRFVLAYELLHTCGESRGGEYPLPDRGTPQEIGSAITYARRYALCAVTGVAPAADDDDGAAATHAQRERFEDARPVRPVQDGKPRRLPVVANARKAITEATEQDALDDIGKRLTAAEQGGHITGDDAVELRRLLVARIDELFPAGEQAAIDQTGEQADLGGDWPEPARPGNPT